ncbi:MAG: hypothetical protein K8H74_11000 [Notoacmeibacter sp.]|nr:hypothetical protein [Notoacmeibacter sp.]
MLPRPARDNIAAARKRPKRRGIFGIRPADVVLSLAGLALAAAAGAFPFYVHRHPDQFSPPRMQFTGLAADVGGEPEDRAPRFKEIASRALLPELDSVVTGTPRRPGMLPGQPNEPGPDQSYPGEGVSMSVIHAIAGRAIIVDGGVIDFIRPNSRLSDGSRVVDIRFNGKSWEIETTSGQTITWDPGAS